MRTVGNGTIRRKNEGVSHGAAPNTKQLTDWDLATNDDAATVQTAGHFNGMADVMQVGEMIFARLDLDGSPAGRIYIVTANSGTAVTVAPIQATSIV
jgi:hypothetical protein